MGDNRTVSYDSRDFGPVPIEKIEGKVLFRFWPLNKFGVVD
jgi:type IV secretory pathway protease TraF